MVRLRSSTVMALVALVAGCGHAAADPTVLRVEPATTAVGPVDPNTACDHLGDLGDAVLDAQAASTADQIAAAIQPQLSAFVDAAAESGDNELAHQASTAALSFTAYLSGDAIAADQFDQALDASGARCVLLGYTRALPQQRSQAQSTAVCAVERKTLETASAAYQALTGQLPASQDLLLQEKLIRVRVDGLELATDGTILVVPGGPCDQ